MHNTQKVLLSHPTGNANVREVLRILEEHAMLSGFVTSIAWREESAVNRVLPSSLKHQLRRRAFHVAPQKTITRPLPEYLRLFSERYPVPGLRRLFHIDRIYQGIDHLTAGLLPDLSPDAVYCYEDGALETFQKAKAQGVTCYYDLPIAYWQTSQSIMAEEAERRPQWARTMQNAQDSPVKLARKTEEAELADVILTPSDFVFQSLPESIRESKKCAVVHFGSSVNPSYKSRKTPTKGPLRLLFAGALTQRKGLADVFQAVSAVNPREIELVVMGSLRAPMAFYRSEYPDFTYAPPRSHQEVLRLMSECDLFILPSLVEGRALVQLEALGVGLPLIVSTNTGGDDLISQDPLTGFKVDIRAPEQIAERLQWFIDNRKEIDAIKAQCRRFAETITWESYRQAVRRAIDPS